MVRDEIINELIGRGYDAEAHDVISNGVKKQAIIIRSDTNCAPTIYMDNLINAINENKMTLADVSDYIVKLNEEHKINVNTDILASRDYILNNVFVGMQKTSDENIVRADSDFDGIEKYLHVKTYVCGVAGSYKLTQKMLDRVGICEAEVWDRAVKNSNDDSEIISMARLMCEMMGRKYDESMEEFDSATMYVVTNKARYKGASAILNKPMLADFARQHNTNKVIVLPSSIHEMIILPYGSQPMDIEDLTGMVKEINATQVNPEEQLTDRAYIVDVA